MDAIKKNQSTIKITILSSIFSASIMLLVLIINRFAPFGNQSMASMDANIQYLDFFSYLQNVMNGTNDIFYTFGKTLGGSNIAIFAYYLASPLNWLVVFFDQTQLHTFFDLLVVLKIGLAGATCSFFLLKRFQNQLNTSFVLIMSASYALMQYTIAQSSNIMWLDGVYMLPLILYGIYQLLKKQRILFLSIAVGLSVLFNWYSGAINSIFACFWFVLEAILYKQDVSIKWKTLAKSAFLFFLAMLLGVMLSGILLLPSVISLMGGRAGMDDYSFSMNFLANPLSALEKLVIGSKSEKGSVSLFSGSFVIIGCFAFFSSAKPTIKQKLVYGGFLCLVLLFFYFEPLIFLFSLLKHVTSYWYRYSYIGVFTLIFIAASFFQSFQSNHTQRKLMLKCGLVFGFLTLLFDFFKNTHDLALVNLSIFFIACCTLLLAFLSSAKRKPRIASCLMLTVVAIELLCNAVLLSRIYQATSVDNYQEYVKNENEIVSYIKQMDNSFFRINQAKPRGAANFNESLTYNYASISGYTSDPDNIQLTFLDRLGYRQNGENMCVVNTSILPADSLLGVKYIISQIPMNGLVEIKAFPSQQQTIVFENPFALPMAFKYNTQKNNAQKHESNPFEYQNWLYGQLLGDQFKLFSQLEYVETKQGAKIEFSIQVPMGAVALYGNLPWREYLNGSVFADDIFITNYSRWLSPSVFYIPSHSEQTDVTIRLEADNAAEGISSVQFYALDLDMLDKAAHALRQQSAQDVTIKNGYFSCVTQGVTGENLYISIPYHKGWTVWRNEQKITPSLFGECMISVPLTNGENRITMRYAIPGAMEGIFVSVAAIVVMMGIMLSQRRSSRS